MATISLIIPVYNAGARIEACLDSVLAQTFDDLETILIDDHGQDDSIDKARNRLAAYTGPKQFRFIATPSNAGPGAARNCGIQAATGDYVAFLDSDDQIDPSFCQDLYEAARQADADMAFCHIVFDGPDGQSVVRRNPAVRPGPFEDAAKRAYLRRFTSYFTTYLYRRSMLLEYGIRFPGTRSAEDSCFLICSLLAARRIAWVDKALYHYLIYPTSTSQKRDPERARNRLESFRHMEAFAREKGLYARYRGVIRFMVLKKGWLMALRDILSNLLHI
ncbi:MAG: glycosyltransferase [Bacteroidales bacterium]|nr:glycosyltransferase [Bacteroidales bacterium]